MRDKWKNTNSIKKQVILEKNVHKINVKAIFKKFKVKKIHDKKYLFDKVAKSWKTETSMTCMMWT